MGLLDGLTTSEPKKPGGLLSGIIPVTPTPKATGLLAGITPVTPKQPFAAVDPSGSYGFSDTERDTSGRPFFAFRSPGDTATTTDYTRVATDFDPRTPAPQTRDSFYNPRAVENRNALKSLLGASYSDHLDHGIALALSGSNNPKNLRVIPGAENQAFGKLEQEFQQKVIRGEISLFDAQVALAKEKSLPVPFTGKKPQKSVLQRVGEFFNIKPQTSTLIRDTFQGIPEKAKQYFEGIKEADIGKAIGNQEINQQLASLAINTVLGLPKALKDAFFPQRGYSPEELAGARPSASQKLAAPAKVVAEISAALGDLSAQIPGYADFLANVAATEIGSRLADAGKAITEFGFPKDANEAKAMRIFDIASVFPIGSIKAFGTLAKTIAASRDPKAIAALLKGEIPELSDDIAEGFSQIFARVDDEVKVESALNKIKYQYGKPVEAKNIEALIENEAVREATPPRELPIQKVKADISETPVQKDAEPTRTFDRNSPLNTADYEALNSLYVSGQKSLDIDSDLIKNLPTNVTGDAAIASILNTTGGSEAYDVMENVASTLIRLGYKDAVDFREKKPFPEVFLGDKKLPTPVDEADLLRYFMTSIVESRKKFAQKAQAVAPEALPVPKEFETLAAEAGKYKSAEEFVAAQQKDTLYHGASVDLGDSPLLKRGYGFGDAGKYTGQDYGGIFFTPSEKYALQYAGSARENALYSYKLTGKEKIFDISNPAAVKQFIDNAPNWEGYPSPKIAVDDAKRIIANLKETAQHGAADWATLAGYENELEMSGFHGAKLLERAGENIEPLADGSFKVTGDPVYSYALFKGDIPVTRAMTKSQLTDLYNRVTKEKPSPDTTPVETKGPFSTEQQDHWNANSQTTLDFNKEYQAVVRSFSNKVDEIFPATKPEEVQTILAEYTKRAERAIRDHGEQRMRAPSALVTGPAGFNTIHTKKVGRSYEAKARDFKAFEDVSLSRIRMLARKERLAKEAAMTPKERVEAELTKNQKRIESLNPTRDSFFVEKLQRRNDALNRRLDKMTIKPIARTETPTEIAPRSRADFVEQERANREFQKETQRDAARNAPSTEIQKVRRQTLAAKRRYTDVEKIDNALGQIMTEFELAEKGERIIMEKDGYFAGMARKPSTFPQWLPEHLRDKKLLDEFLKKTPDLASLKYPDNITSLNKAELVDAVFDQLDAGTGISTKEVRKGIVDQYKRDVRATNKEEAVLNRVAEKGYKKVAELIDTDVKKKAAIERARLAQEESVKRVAAQQEFFARRETAIKDAARKARKSTGLAKKFRETFFPIRETDEVTQRIYHTWQTKKLAAKEMANQTIEDFKKQGYKVQDDLDIIFDYQAGNPIPWIRNHLDSMWTEATRRGLEVPYKQDYFPQVYRESPRVIREKIAEYIRDNSKMTKEEIEAYLDGDAELPETLAIRLKMRPFFERTRFFPDYKTAMRYGLHPKFDSILEHFAYYREEMERVIANKDMIDDFIKEFKFLDTHDAPDGWEFVKLPGNNRRQWMASPNLATALNKQFALDPDMTLIQYFMKIGARLSNTMTNVSLSGGIPNTPINYFAFGQLYKALTTALGTAAKLDFPASAAELRAARAWIRTFSDARSIKWLDQNKEYIRMMGEEGIRIDNRIGVYDEFYNATHKIFTKKNIKEIGNSLTTGLKNLLGLMSKEKRKALFGTDEKGAISKLVQDIGDSQAGERLAEGFDYAFGRKTFRSFLPQMQIEIFKSAYDAAVKGGLPKEAAQQFAGNLVKNEFGIILNEGRPMAVQNAIDTMIMAPRFREALLNFMINNAKAFTTQVRNPEFKQNRAFMFGAILTFALYQLINYSLNKEFTLENEEGRKFSIKTKLPNGDIAYIEFLPSVFATPRMVAQAGMAFAEGDLAEGSQKLGGLLSMPAARIIESFTNRDHFNRPIYKSTDSPAVKTVKAIGHVPAGFVHPYFREIGKYMADGQPLYQALSIMAEIPVKYSNTEKELRSKYYEEQEEITAEKKAQLEKLRPTFEKIQAAKLEGNTAEAQKIVDALSEADYARYKQLVTQEKRIETLRRKPFILDLIKKNKALIEAGKPDEAQAKVDALSEEDYRLYKMWK